MRVILLALAALLAFAANSVLCRLALGDDSIDPASFATVRVLAGVITLVLLSRMSSGPAIRGDRWSAVALFAYMAAFAFAYESLPTGTGALILFGCVQLTMLLWALRTGERPPLSEWVGLILALGGLVYLVLPGLQAPSTFGSVLMAIAGIGWGVYSLRGRGVTSPLAETAGNFARCLPMVACVSLVTLSRARVETSGLLLAIASGALASGVGYAVWYAVLPSLATSRAAIVQLAVPVIAALGGVVFLDEDVTSRLVVAMVFVLGGVGLAIAGRSRGVPRSNGDVPQSKA